MGNMTGGGALTAPGVAEGRSFIDPVPDPDRGFDIPHVAVQYGFAPVYQDVFANHMLSLSLTQGAVPRKLYTTFSPAQTRCRSPVCNPVGASTRVRIVWPMG